MTLYTHSSVNSSGQRSSSPSSRHSTYSEYSSSTSNRSLRKSIVPSLRGHAFPESTVAGKSQLLVHAAGSRVPLCNVEGDRSDAHAAQLGSHGARHLGCEAAAAPVAPSVDVANRRDTLRGRYQMRSGHRDQVVAFPHAVIH